MDYNILIHLYFKILTFPYNIYRLKGSNLDILSVKMIQISSSELDAIVFVRDDSLFGK